MLSGVKFIPRDELNPESHAAEDSKLHSSRKERKKSRSRKGKDKSKNKRAHYDSSDDEGIDKLKKRSNNKNWYSSDASSLSLSESESDEVRVKLKEKVKRRRKHKSDEDSLSSDDGGPSGIEDQRGGRKHKRSSHSRKQSGIDALDEKDSSEDDRDSILHDVARKEMGLEWMLKPANQAERIPKHADDMPEDLQVEKVKKQNPRELNPYFKDDGSGYPEDASQTNQILSSSVVGDGGASWRLKALKRAKEQAAREGRNLDEVVEERWGSLGQLAVSVASHTVAPAHAHLRAIKDRRGRTENCERVTDDQTKKGTEKAHGDSREYFRGASRWHSHMREPKLHDSLSWGKRRAPKMSVEDTHLISEAVSNLNKFADDGDFLHEFNRRQKNDANGSSSTSHTNDERNEDQDSVLVSSKSNHSSERCSASRQVLTANQLAAKVLQLRMKGKHEEAEKLLKESETTTVDQDSRAKTTGQDTIISYGRSVPSRQKKMEDNADVHLAAKIVQNKQFSMSGRADDEYDFDDAPSKKQRQKKRRNLEHKTEKNITPTRFPTQQERCHFCFENPTRPRHLVVSVANFTYLMLPQWQPVVQGHCCILTLQHESATRSVDNNVWEEIRNFKKCLIMMFAKQDREVVFLETVMGLAQQRHHCLVECIPLPSEIAKQAPLYFKKAIDEAEEEWSQHNAKRLIDTSEKGLRGSIPKDFPYFHVEFGLNKGFVHVIDDERQFKSNLGLNVIRGMLQLPEEDMYRRRKQDSVETQKQAVASFAHEWEPFDWTKQLD